MKGGVGRIDSGMIIKKKVYGKRGGEGGRWDGGELMEFELCQGWR